MVKNMYLGLPKQPTVPQFGTERVSTLICSPSFSFLMMFLFLLKNIDKSVSVFQLS